MPTYTLSGPVRVSAHDPVLGFYDVQFEAGPVEPKSEQEEAALALLVEQGHFSAGAPVPVPTPAEEPDAPAESTPVEVPAEEPPAEALAEEG